MAQEGADTFRDCRSIAISSCRKAVAQEARKRKAAQGVAGESGLEMGLIHSQRGGDGELPTGSGRRVRAAKWRAGSYLVIGTYFLAEIATDQPLPQR